VNQAIICTCLSGQMFRRSNTEVAIVDEDQN
jgi:hypothetical protein